VLQNRDSTRIAWRRGHREAKRGGIASNFRRVTKSEGTSNASAERPATSFWTAPRSKRNLAVESGCWNGSSGRSHPLVKLKQRGGDPDRPINTMKALRHLVGILLGSAALLLLLTGIGAVSNQQLNAPWWMGGMYLCFGFASLVGSLVLLRRTLFGAPARQCPQCGNTDYRVPALSRARRQGWLIDWLGKHLLGSLWGASREQKVLCAACQTPYFTHTRGSRIAGVLLWVFLFFVLFGQLASKIQMQ